MCGYAQRGRRGAAIIGARQHKPFVQWVVMITQKFFVLDDINVGDVRLTENLRGNFRSRIAGGCGFDCAARTPA